MNAVQILERCRQAPQDRESIMQRIQRYRDGAMSISRYGVSAGGHGTGGEDKLAEIASQIDEAERARAQRDREYVAEVAAACTLLDRLPDQESRVLHLYYVQGDTLNLISERMHNSYGYVRKLKSDGLALAQTIGLVDVARALPPWYNEQELRRLDEVAQTGGLSASQRVLVDAERAALREAMRSAS